jgi:hypothetical protein
MDGMEINVRGVKYEETQLGKAQAGRSVVDYGLNVTLDCALDNRSTFRL